MKRTLIDNYTKPELERIVQQSHNYSEVLRKIGYRTKCNGSISTLKKRLLDYGVSTAHFYTNTNRRRITETDVFRTNSSVSQKTLRHFYIKKGYSEYICSICGMPPVWNDSPITLILDHIDGCHNNNIPNNLRWVCPNCNSQLETTKKRRAYRAKIINLCPICNNELAYSAKICRSCYQARLDKKLLDFVSREELKNAIRTKSFLELSSIYGVSDNAIRKWCKKYGLPFKRTDIKSYTDEEWLNL